MAANTAATGPASRPHALVHRHVQVHFAFYDKTGEMAAIEMVKTPGNACWYNITDLGTVRR